MKRRSFLIRSSIAGYALAIRPRLAFSMRRTPKYNRYMRLDSHNHLYDGGGNIDMIGQYFINLLPEDTRMQYLNIYKTGS